ncbi:MAG TPA: CDP-diacylglycerol--glycerol-3-phosphate 3-phosphatidyltransferase [candidate division Zixibacteria bacterium]|nr:CDP-diacylglycerol--glycerol-3-phosphate 3-phosphatidyltransferase [candidate division Zixibacteria bacterium]
MNWPNRLTLTRILLAPVFMIFFLIEGVWPRLVALLIFIIAAVTDIMDGWIARKYNITTGFGKFMDPLADKILASIALIAFVVLDYARAWMVLPIIIREFFIMGLRSLAAYKGMVITPTWWAKLKTFLQMVSIGLILLFVNLQTFIPAMGERWDILTDSRSYLFIDGILFITMVITVATGIDYIVKYFYLLKNVLR